MKWISNRFYNYSYFYQFYFNDKGKLALQIFNVLGNYLSDFMLFLWLWSEKCKCITRYHIKNLLLLFLKINIYWHPNVTYSFKCHLLTFADVIKLSLDFISSKVLLLLFWTFLNIFTIYKSQSNTSEKLIYCFLENC